MAVRSERLARALVTGVADQVLYTVPAGRRVLVKSVFVANTSAGGVTVFLGIGGTVAGSQWWTVFIEATNFRSLILANGWVALNAGETLVARATVANAATFTVSGTVLVL